ncbi:RBP11-like subunits of RNA polymerase [Eremomyces bilateralis CBS 781.70]|uniref:DNA-directed RNA polymerases I and III subunit RPAC2 n=1 Tax=Eremomyces bilateralis CBS 781.70 TaxID=1392243 RepID=A0A6G1G4Y7_9PEZI|nr:RBP11-like subunits of RNA polymerase [Eremomyces bilateralis CBS 781.70]KAF1813114.1 RBP11-like subunits of RNA polymerase [Eremomyces bilateralis CBS 781.70]
MSASAEEPKDVEMTDAQATAGAAHGESSAVEDTDDDFVDPDAEPKINMLPGSTDTEASFQFDKEDHTLGNALRWIIMKNPEVEFCGYTIPHPAEAKMNFRIQTYDGANVRKVLEKGLNDLMDLCDVVIDKFTISRDEFNDQQE